MWPTNIHLLATAFPLGRSSCMKGAQGSMTDSRMWQMWFAIDGAEKLEVRSLPSLKQFEAVNLQLGFFFESRLQFEATGIKAAVICSTSLLTFRPSVPHPRVRQCFGSFDPLDHWDPLGSNDQVQREVKVDDMPWELRADTTSNIFQHYPTRKRLVTNKSRE